MDSSSRRPVRDADRWRDLLPALGLIFGSAALLLYATVSRGASASMAIAVAIGAGIGLVLGSIVWLRQRR